MRFAAKDGSMHPSQKAAYDHGIKRPKAPHVTEEHDSDKHNDPEAMQHVQALKDKGYTADDVAKMMGDGDSDDMSAMGGEAVKAAPMQIPGM